MQDDVGRIRSTPLRIERAAVADIAEAVAVQHRAFMRVARWLGLEDATQLDPIAESADEVERLVAEGTATVLVARLDTGDAAPIVGTVRGQAGSDGSVEVGRLAVDDGLEGRGIGRALMEAIEVQYPDARRFVLFTGRDAAGPIHLYDSLGYRIVEEREFRLDLFLVWMEKCRTPRVDSTP